MREDAAFGSGSGNRREGMAAEGPDRVSRINFAQAIPGLIPHVETQRRDLMKQAEAFVAAAEPSGVKVDVASRKATLSSRCSSNA